MTESNESFTSNSWFIYLLFIFCALIALVGIFFYIRLPIDPIRYLPASLNELCYHIKEYEIGSDYSHQIKAKLSASEFEAYRKKFPELLKLNNLDEYEIFSPGDGEPIWWDLRFDIKYDNCWGEKIKDGQTFLIYHDGYMYYLSYKM